MNFVPLANRIVAIRVKAGEEVRESGLILTADVSKPYFKATVVAVGRGVITQTGEIIKPETQIGDTVLLFNTPAFVLPEEDCPELKDNEECVIFSENDAVAIIKKA